MKTKINTPKKIGLFLLFTFINVSFEAKNIALKTIQEEDTNTVKALNKLSKVLTSKSKLDSAIFCSKSALELAKKLDFKSGIGRAYSGLGNIYEIKGNSAEALSNYQSMLKIEEEIGDKHGAAWAYGCISRLYGTLQNYVEALKYAFNSKELMSEVADSIGEIKGYLLIGDCYASQSKYIEAMDNFKTALDKSQKINYSEGVSSALSSIGDDYFRQANYKESLNAYFLALKIAEQDDNKYIIALSYLNIGICNKNLNNLDSSLSFLLKSLSLSKKIYEAPFIIESQKDLSDVYALKGNTAKAFEYYKSYIASRDTFINAEKTKKTLTLEMTYQFDKKQQELKLEQEKKDAIQKTILSSVICGLVLTFMLCLVVFRSYKRKQKDNVLLTQQKIELHEKNTIIEDKQKEILASIRYAKRIQVALITSEKYIEKSLDRLIK